MTTRGTKLGRVRDGWSAGGDERVTRWLRPTYQRLPIRPELDSTYRDRQARYAWNQFASSLALRSNQCMLS